MKSNVKHTVETIDIPIATQTLTMAKINAGSFVMGSTSGDVYIDETIRAIFLTGALHFDHIDNPHIRFWSRSVNKEADNEDSRFFSEMLRKT